MNFNLCCRYSAYGFETTKLIEMPRQKSGEGKQATKRDCIHCEGTRNHFGGECGGCNGTGKDIVRKQKQKVHNAENDLPLNYNLDAK